MAIGAQRADGDLFTTECSRDEPSPAFEADVIFGGWDGPNDLVLIVLDHRKAIWHWPGTYPVAAGRHLLTERLMWSIEVVDGAPGIERPLHLGEIAEP